MKLAYGTADGSLHEVSSIPIADLRARGDLVEGIVQEVRLAIRDAPNRFRVQSVGLAVPGIVDEAMGVGRLSMILGWRQVPFARLVVEATGLPTGFGHDVCSGALAEGRLGAARGHTNWLFLALGTGLGSAFMLGGRPYRGFNGYGGELSHIVADPAGPPCRCGKRGCLEMLASASAIADRYMHAVGSKELVTAAEVARRVRAGDEFAVRVWDDAVSALATVVAGYIESMNPSAVVVGGGLAEAGEMLLAPLRDQLEAQVQFADHPAVLPALLGARAGLHGAAMIGLHAAGVELSVPAPSSLSNAVSGGGA